MPQQLPAPPGGIKPAGKLGGLQQIAPVIEIGGIVGVGRLGKKLFQWQTGDELRLVVNCLAEGFQRQAPPERLLAGGGIDGHSAACMIKQLRQFSTGNVIDTICNVILSGQGCNVACQSAPAALQGMGFEHQAVMTRRTGG